MRTWGVLHKTYRTRHGEDSLSVVIRSPVLSHVPCLVIFSSNKKVM